MDHAKRGAAALASSDSATAVEAYTNALIEHPTSPDYFTQRSIAFSRLKPPRHDLALKDADYGVLCGQKRGKRDKMQAAQQRRVICLYNLGQYADAKFILESMKKWRPKDSKPQEMEHNMWMAKIENKLKLGSQEKTIKEYPSETLPDEKTLKKILQNQLKVDGTFDFDGEQKDVEMAEDNNTTAQASSAQSNGTSSAIATPSAPPQKVRHEWYQNNQSVIITLYAKGVKKDSADVDFEDDSISISFPHPSDSSSTYTFNLDPLFALINPSKSKFQVMSTKIELTLAKALPGQKWANIEGTTPLKRPEDTPSVTSSDHAKAAILTALHQNASHHATPAAATPVVPQQTAPAYPTSSRHGPKNWDKLADDLTAKKPKSKDKKDKKDKAADKNSADDSDSAPEDDYESDTGGDAVDGFFKKLYKNADDDTRKAMMKSFQESNGTALSTNWSEVSRAKVEEVKSKDEN